MKHTKGPWKVDENYPSDVLAENRAIVIQDDAINIGSEETKANATLIAAAPEMLEALEKLKHVLETRHDAVFNKLEVGFIAKAIKKAKGGAE